uniref:NADH dehydrogenase subunit 4L n=1 Tax=Longidorus vineacola TaxID=241698 RepID=A0A1P8C761_9BILA|nr:NADH dehydrogenase subunit 4L [Longidorus vineacola]AOT84239.1 NADH dehydrogenase subunit 4L [Longidorus vineacola]
MMLTSSVGVTLLVISLKWKTLLMSITLMELSSTFVLAILLTNSSIINVILIMLPFFVSEALIMLTAFYSTTQTTGSALSSLILY